jgi:Dolichyl-phosphate-mannose-protein mannosyltransferase
MMHVKAAPLALLAIAVFAVSLRVIFFTGYHGFDDSEYIVRAVELSRGGMTRPATHWAARIGMVAPTALSYRGFGVTPVSTVAWPFVCSALGVFVAYLLGRRLYGPPTGLTAAFLLAVFPQDVIFASVLYPTEPVMLLAGSGVGLFLLAERERKPVLYVASGFAVGAAAVVHEAALIALAFYPLYVLLSARPARAHVLAAIGLAIGLALDPIAHAFTGDAWARLSIASAARTARGVNPDVAYRGFNVSWLGEPLVRPFVERTFGLFSWLLAPVLAYRLWKPSAPNDRALALVVAAGYLWVAYGTVSLTAYAPLARLPRYGAPLVLPALWLLGHEISERLRPRSRLAVLAALAATSLACLMMDSGSALRPYQDIKAVLARLQPTQVAVERPHLFPLLFAEGFAPPYAASELGGDIPRGSVVIAATEDVKEKVEALPGAETLARIVPPETLYLKLLRSGSVAAILRLTRPAARIKQYDRKTEGFELRVYRVR